MTAAASPIRFAGSSLGDFRHVCAFFNEPDDEYRVMLPFLRDGLAQGQRDVTVVPRDRSDHLERLRGAGIDVDAARRHRQLEVLRSEETYEPEGRFDQDAMLELIEALLEQGRDLGFPLTRLVAHAEHVTASLDGAESFVEYEARLNYVLPQYPDVVICTYDLRHISASVALDVLRTHPVTIVGGVLMVNPFFVPPKDFLREMRGRTRRRRESDVASG